VFAPPDDGDCRLTWALALGLDGLILVTILWLWPT
jgi:hypothetical protein